MRKTPLMRRIETDHKEPLERLIVRLTNETDWPDTHIAAYLGIGKATLTYWCLLAGIQTRRVRLLPGQRVEIAGPQPSNGHRRPMAAPTVEEAEGIPTPEAWQRYDQKG